MFLKIDLVWVYYQISVEPSDIHIPLHLRSNVVNRNKMNKQTKVAAVRILPIAMKRKRITLLNRQDLHAKYILQPDSFLQLVHAIVAPNDIYGGTSCPYHNN